MRQSPLPFDNKIGTVNVNGDFYFNEAGPSITGTPDESATIKITSGQKERLGIISVATNKGMSTLGREAIQWYLDFFPLFHKMYRYKKQITALLETMP